MMKRMIRSGLSLALCFMIAFSLFPMSALAESKTDGMLYSSEDGLSMDVMSSEEMSNSSLSQLYMGTKVGRTILGEGETTDPTATPTPEQSIPTEPAATDNAIVPVSSLLIELPAGVTEVHAGETISLEVRILPENASITKIEWTSNHPEIASIDKDGTLTALSSGLVEIMATAQDGSAVTGKLEINILPAEGAATEETPLPIETPMPSEEPGLLDGLWRYRIDENGHAIVLGYEDTSATFLKVPDKLGGSFVKGIDANALADLTALARIRIHGNVMTIGENALPVGVGVEAYHGSAALNYAKQNQLEAKDLSDFYFVDGVIDYSDIETGRYAFAGDTTIRMKPLEASRLVVGSVFYLPASEKYPNGEGFIVESISASGSWVTLACSVARGEEIISRLVVENSVLTPDWDNAILYDGVTLSDDPVITGGMTSSTQSNDPEFLSLGGGGSQIQGKSILASKNNNYLPSIFSVSNSQSFSIEKEFGGIWKFEVKADAKIKATIEADINLIGRKINRFSCIHEETISGSASLSCKIVEKNSIEENKHTGEFKIARVPLVGYVFCTVFMDIGVKFDISGKATLTFSYATKSGKVYDKSTGQMKDVSFAPESKIGSLSLSGEIKLGFYFALGVNAFLVGDIIKITASAGIKVKAKYTFGSSDIISINLFFFLELKCTSENKMFNLKIGVALIDLEFAIPWIYSYYKIGVGFITDDEYFSLTGDSFSLKFVTGTNEKIENQKVTVGYCATQPSITAPANATLLGWFLSDGTKWDFSRVVSSDMTLYARWRYSDGTVGGSTPAPTIPGATPTPPPVTSGLLYSLTDGKITITGYSGTPTSQNLVIPSQINGYPVVAIADSAFYSNKKFTGSLIIQPGVQSIGTRAFGYCGFTGNLSLPDTITQIGDSAFWITKFTGTLKIPSSLSTINASCFQGTNFTGQLIIPASVLSIGGFAFSGCDGFTGELVIPENVTTIGRNAFAECTGFSGTLKISSGVTNLEIQSFEGCTGITNLNLPNSVQSIGINAFRNCTGLTGQLVLPKGLKSISHEAFGGCIGLTGSINLPAELMFIPCNPFNGCYGVSGYTVDPDNQYFKVINGLILNKNGTFLYSCLPSLRGELIIPNGVTYINQSALLQCKNISSVIIPNTMRTITMRAFDSCSSLNKVTISEGTTAIEYMAFANCPNLKEVYIPASVVTFEPDVFKGSTQAVIYGYAGSAAQSYALSNGIAFITIQNNKHSIFFDAMNGNTMHQESYFTGNLVPSPAAPSRGGYVFTGWYRDAACTSLWDFDNDIMPNNDLTLYAGWRVENTDFSYEVVDDQGGIIHTASLGEGYTTQDAWDGASITIKDYSGGLSTLVIPDTIAGLPVTAIADYAFADCDLNKITIPASVTNIGDKAFYGCENLAVITVASGNPSYTTVSNVLFNANQTKLLRYAPVKSGTSYTIPSTVTSIGSYAFYACEGLTSITLPTGMQSIGENAFENCTGLLSLTFPNNVTTLGSSLFNGCDPELQLYGPVATCAIKTYAEANYLDYNLYTVNYYNGADNFHSQQVRAGDLVPEIQEPMDDILRFDSWCKTSDLTTVWNPETDFMPAADLDLYLRWKCDYTYTGTTTLTITGYTGTDNFLRIPSAIQGKTVTKIAAGALNSTAAKPYYEIMIPSTVTSIASGAITWESEDCKPELLCDSGSAGAAYATANGLVNGAIQYAVNYQANGGRAIATQNVAPGALLTVPTTLRDNYTLDGWFSDESFTQPWDFATSTMPTQDITLYAKWTIVDANIPPLAYTYESANGEVTVTGYIGTKTFATIPSSINGEPVTAIADFFLQDDNRVQKLTIPSSVTMVGDYAFQDSILAEVVFESGGSTLTIGNCAFYGCNYLTSVTIPRTMTTLSAHLFHGCTGLLSLDLPDGITIIDDGTFYGCANLRSLTLPATVTSIGTSAFAECYALRNVIFLGTPPTGLKSGAFRYTNTNLILLYQAGTSGWSTPTYTYTDEDETESVFNTAEYGSSGYISSLTPSRERGVLGQPIKWTAAVAGTTSAMEYQFTLYQNEESEPIATQAFTSSNTFTYTPATVGSYRVIAVAKDTEENMTSPRSSSVNITTKVVPVNSVSLNYETLSMNPDDMQQLTASVLPLDATDQTLKWTSSNPNVASVSASGVVTAIAMGSTTITATSTSGVKAECVVTTTIRMVPQLVLKATSHEVIAENSFTITVQYRYFDVLPTLINWQSSDTTIATVDAAGKVTCLKPGAVKIRATANDEEGTFAEFDLTVLPIPVSQITVSVGNGMLAVGANKQYSFTISPENASDKSVVWSIVSGEIYASIDETRGFLTGISPGSVVIRATAADGSDIYGEATIQVVDYKVQISGKSEVLAGKTLQLTSSLLPSNLTNTNVVWSLKIGDSAYASISTTGLVTAKALTHRQTITVIASSKDGAALQAEKQITIYPVTTAIQILNNDVNVTGQTLVLNSNAAESLTFTSAMIPSDASIGVSWTMSATTSASLEVTNEGKSAVISPIAGKSGKITLTAKANDGSGKTAVVYIQVAVLSSGVTVSDPKSGVLYSGKSTQLVATFTDPQPSNKAVKWVLSPEYDTFATLSATGLLTAKAVTEAAVIKVVAVPLDGGPESAPYEVTIKPYTSSMQILRGETYVTNTTLTVDFGHEDSLQLTAVAWPYSASQDVTFLSSIPSIATVDETGMVTVLKTGLVSITAKATDGSGKLASVKLNIVKLPQQIEAVSPVLGLYGGSSATYRVKDAAAAANVILPASQVRWTLDGDCANIAKITTGGVLTTFAVNEQQTVTLKAEVIGNEEIANTTVDVTIYPTTQSIRLYKGEAPLTGAIIFDTYNLPDGGDDGVALSVLTIPEGAMQEMAWSSSNPAIATVTDGVVKPVWNNSTSAYNKGVATITAKTKDGTNLSVSATVQVLSLAQSVTLTTVSGETELISGASLQLKATLGNSSATNPKVYYSIVSGAEYATVSIGGLVTAKTVYKEEIIVVRATTAEGLSQDDLDLKILPKEADPLVIQPIDGSAPYNGTRQSFNIKSAAAAVQIAAIGYATGDPVIVKWTVSPSTIGKVSIIGGVATLQSITTGVVTVTATDAKGRTASFTAEFYKPATSLTITPPKGMDVAELKLSSGKTMQLTGVLAPTTGVTTAGVNWYIGVELEGAMKYYKDTNLASISSTGLVTAKAGLTTPATVKIYAVTKNAPYLTDSVDITILPAVTGVDILFDGEVANNKSYTMNLAVKTTNLSAIVWPAAANQSVTWTSSDKLIATIAADGTLTALKTGTVTITAKADGKISTFKLTISVLPTGIEITSKTGFEMRAGGTLQLAIAFTPTNATDKRVSWALLGDGAQFAKISSTGLVTAKAGTKQQTIDVKATSFADKNLTWTQKITIYPATTKVQILDTAENDVSGKTLILDLNEMTEMTLLAKNLPSMEGGARQGVTWKSSNTAVLRVAADGTLTPVRKSGSELYYTGTVTITATASDGSGKYASVKVFVGYLVTSITFADGLTVKGGYTLALKPTFEPINATNKAVKWTIKASDTPYATISSTGVITAKKLTEARDITIYCEALDGSGVIAEIKVNITM